MNQIGPIGGNDHKITVELAAQLGQNRSHFFFRKAQIQEPVDPVRFQRDFARLGLGVIVHDNAIHHVAGVQQLYQLAGAV